MRQASNELGRYLFACPVPAEHGSTNLFDSSSQKNVPTWIARPYVRPRPKFEGCHGATATHRQRRVSRGASRTAVVMCPATDRESGPAPNRILIAAKELPKPRN